MAYTPTSWTNGTTPVNATNMNHLETQYTEATHSYEQFFINGFVLTGFAATKDGTTASQLDVTAGTAYLKQADGTLRSQSPTSSTQSCLGHPSTTLYLFLNNDGTWTFGTSSSGPANSLPICQVTTDASSNILTVTDVRPTTITLWPAADGGVAIPHALKSLAGQASAGSFGVPVIVATPAEFHITTTTLQNPLYSFSVPAAGMYRVSGALNKASGGNSYVYLRVAFTGFHTNAIALQTFMAVSGGLINTVMPLQGSTSTNQLPDAEYGLIGSTMYVAAGGVISIAYQDLSGTPNDYVLIIIERLS